MAGTTLAKELAHALTAMMFDQNRPFDERSSAADAYTPRIRSMTGKQSFIGCLQWAMPIQPRLHVISSPISVPTRYPYRQQ